jgi:large subunit ribosomal protein L35
MPKMKTHSGAKKRFRKTAGGKIQTRHAFTSHILGKKPAKRKRRLAGRVTLSGGDRREAKNLLAGKGR